jgi:hypothetical protein
MKLKLILLAGTFVFGFAMTANAGAIVDTDVDAIPDVFDNCLVVPNGPAQDSNQIDTDEDGFGNICDADFNNSGSVTGADFTIFIASFNTGDPLTDMNGSGSVTGADFTLFIGGFNLPPGPSGLGCADPTLMPPDTCP